MFDYKGYSQEKIETLCDIKKISSGIPWLFWTSEVYSFGRQIREYGFFPNFLPLNIYSEHGMTILKVIQDHELNNDAYCMFCHRKKRAELYKTLSSKPCYTFISPLIMYRRLHKIKQSKDAVGTLIFPAHTVPECIDKMNLDNYIAELKALPEEFQPVCVSLHMHDIKKGIHKKYLEQGIPVYTAGHANDVRYAKRFYEVLKNFKYSMSNDTGSYMVYSMEMGIPFSIYGTFPQFYYENSPHVPNGHLNFDELYDNYDNVLELFRGNPTEITSERQAFLEEFAGLKDGISRLEMCKILWTAYFKYLTQRNHLKDTLKYLKRYPLFFLRKDFWQQFFS